MASFWSPAVDAVVNSGVISTIELVEIRVDTQLQKSDLTDNADTGIFLTGWHGNIEIAGNEYVSDLMTAVAPPPVSGEVTQEVQSLLVSQQLASFGDQDFVALLGPNYHQAPIILTIYVVDSNGVPLTDPEDVFYRSDGIITKVSREIRKGQVQVEFSNSYGQLQLIQELRTTVGSLKRLSATDTSFNKAAAIDPTITLSWGIRD